MKNQKQKPIDPCIELYEARIGKCETDEEIYRRVKRDKRDIFGRSIELMPSLTAEEITRQIATKYTNGGHMISLSRVVGGGQYKRYDKALRPVRFHTTNQPPDGVRIFSLDKVAEEIELALCDLNEDNANVSNIGLSMLEDFLRGEDFRTLDTVRKKEMADSLSAAAEEYIEYRDGELDRFRKELYSDLTDAEDKAAEEMAKDAAERLCGVDVASSVEMLEEKEREMAAMQREIERQREEIERMQRAMAASQKSEEPKEDVAATADVTPPVKNSLRNFLRSILA